MPGDGKSKYPLLPYPAAYWTLDRATNGYDSSKNGYGLPSGLSYAPGKFGDALSEFGLSAVRIGHPFGTNLIRDTPISVSLWITNIGAVSGAWRGFYVTDDSPPVPSRILLAANYNSGSGALAINVNYGGRSITNVLSNASERPYHIASTSDGVTLRLYIDGIENNTLTMVGSTGSFLINDAIWITGGMVDDVAVWNGTLTPNQIKAIADSPVPIMNLI